LASQGIRFENAVTSVPLTLPSHATILTGLYPPNHGARSNGKGFLPADRVTLAETLRERGYDTAAFIGCFVLDARFGLDQGFQLYDFVVTDRGHRPNMVDFNERSADQVTDAAIHWLRQRGGGQAAKPFFAWVHYFDAHLPYRSPLGNDPRFAGRPYDAEIAFVDQQFGRLLGELETEGLHGRTLIVVAADHGEALGEHGEQTHGMLLYDPTVRVPLLLSCPARTPAKGQVHRQLVGLADLRPSIEDLLGLPITLPCDGWSFLSHQLPKDRSVYLETMEPRDMAGWSPLFGLRTAQTKYIEGPMPRFFDLQADPKEVVNLYNSGPPGLAGVVQGLHEIQRTWSDAAEGARAMSDEEIERLMSLGYVHSGKQTTTSAPVDPEAMLPVLNRSSEAERLYSEGKLPEAEKIAREVLQRWPDSPQALRVLAFCQLQAGRSGEAVELLRRSIPRDGNAYLLRSLAQVLILSGDYARAEEVLGTYESLAPDDGRVDLLRGDCLARQNRKEQAAASYRQAITLDSNRVGIDARQRIADLYKAPAAPGAHPGD
jgi:arylsulfatase A-like enzyme